MGDRVACLSWALPLRPSQNVARIAVRSCCVTWRSLVDLHRGFSTLEMPPSLVRRTLFLVDMVSVYWNCTENSEVKQNNARYGRELRGRLFKPQIRRYRMQIPLGKEEMRRLSRSVYCPLWSRLEYAWYVVVSISHISMDLSCLCIGVVSLHLVCCSSTYKTVYTGWHGFVTNLSAKNPS